MLYTLRNLCTDGLFQIYGTWCIYISLSFVIICHEVNSNMFYPLYKGFFGNMWML